MSSPETTSTAPRHIFRWDLDKTYLRTDFDTIRDLLRTAFERPERKRTVPGAAALLRELKAVGPVQITILSGSPEQMRETLEAKLRLDGVQWDEFVLKPNLRNLLRLRLRALRDQVGYKLPALLNARTRAEGGASETLFGDDAEADALVYSLYADILGDRIGEQTLLAVLEKCGAYRDAIDETLRLARALEKTDPVRRIFIHLDRKSDPAFFRRYGARVVPIYNYFQAAIVLVHDGVLSAEAAVRIGAVLAIEHDFDVRDLIVSAHDTAFRVPIDRRVLGQLADAARAIVDPFPLHAAERTELAKGLDGAAARTSLVPPAPSGASQPFVIDYLAALADDRARWEAAKARARRDAREA